MGAPEDTLVSIERVAGTDSSKYIDVPTARAASNELHIENSNHWRQREQT